MYTTYIHVSMDDVHKYAYNDTYWMQVNNRYTTIYKSGYTSYETCKVMCILRTLPYTTYVYV